MGSAGNNAERKVDSLGQKQVGCGNQRFRIGCMIKHFLTAVIHVNTGIPTDIRLCDHFQNLTGMDP